MKSDSQKGTALAVGAAIWAAGFVLPYRRATLLADASQVAFGLMAWAAVQTSLFVFWQTRGRKQRAPHAWRTTLRAAALLGVCSAAGNLFSALGLRTVQPALHSVVLRSEIVFVGLLASVFLRERPTRWLLIGTSIAVAGLALMNFKHGPIPVPTGVLWGLAAAACFGTIPVVTRKLVHRIDVVTTNALRLWIASAALLAMPGVATGVWRQPARFWMLTGIAALCGPAVSRLLSMQALRFVPASYSTLLLLLTPALVYPLAFVIDGTLPTAQQTLGALVMLMGLAAPMLEALQTRPMSAVAAPKGYP